MRQRSDTGAHYEALAGEYDELWVYRPEYVPWMSARIAEALRLGVGDRVADIGTGTGLFAQEIARQVRPRQPILCVDPSQAMLSQIAPSPDTLTPLLASAEDVAERRVTLPYDQLDAVFMKESVHHLADQAGTLRGLADWLAPGGRLLVVMLPTTIQYPLFQAALDRFEELQPDPADIVEHLRAAGLEADLGYVEHELRIDKERYLRMVRARYMSLLSTFSDGEMEGGLEEMRAAHPEAVLTFPDRFAFVLGERRGEGR
ncbi:methyltransferase [Streptomyces sp. B93]|uniref:class I SAM-dependent methyltransferase n=1 Tax=Streptomyces sp. B93 TaxID=2824875 RepID=UPI0027E42EB5|nr:methyltransferase [Streptomyces sp. B93]